MTSFVKDEKKKRILIASHAQDEVPLIESRLTARDYEVETAESSIEVVHKVNRNHFDLILLDAQMEEVRHTELAELLRKRSVLRTIPIVMITDRDDVTSLISSVNKGFDDFYIRPIDPLSFQLRIALNIRRAEEKLEINPLTQLPGNASIEKTINHFIQQGSLFSIIYADLNSFKPLNDILGFKKGDEAIKQTAYILESNTRNHSGKIDSFVGHVGGDDFVIIACPTVAEKIARNIIQDFDRIMLNYYPPEIQRKGYVEVKNRKGAVEKFPLISISLAEVSNEYIPIRTSSEAAHRLTEVKKFLKTQIGSYHLKCRRGKPFDSLEEAAGVLKPFKKEAIEPIGQMLLKAGMIDEEQLSKALEVHFKTGQKLGKILIAMRAIPAQELGKMLEKKVNIPYVPLSFFEPTNEMLELFSASFVKARRIAPLEFSEEKNTIYLGMVDPLDKRVMDEVEEITGCSVESRLVLEDEFEEHLSRFYGVFVD